MVFALNTVKYAFRIKTRTGMVVENLTIHGREESDAQRKLLQMYPHCQVLECRPLARSAKPHPASFEEVLSLVAK
ncbi:MAG TPA: hypothetical protein VLD36_22360 [Burkholderiales bacterium]|jgi:hypothetical protein|nr:hypothetical protein [Burkholderiales bacterium]